MQGRLVYPSESVVGEPVSLVQQDEATWSIEFGPLVIERMNGISRLSDRTL